MRNTPHAWIYTSYVKLTYLVTLVQCKYPIRHKRCVHDPVPRPVHGIGWLQYDLCVCVHDIRSCVCVHNIRHRLATCVCVCKIFARSQTMHRQGQYHRMLVAEELSQSEIKKAKVQGKWHQNCGKLAYNHHVKKRYVDTEDNVTTMSYRVLLPYFTGSNSCQSHVFRLSYK